jgi:hypothetical protein
MAFFAVYGLIVVFGGKSRLNAFRGRMFLSAFCVAALFAFAMEIVCFNYKHFLKYFAGGEFHTTEVSAQDRETVLTTDSGVVARIYVDRTDSSMTASWVTFTNVDRKVTSVFVQPIFNKYELLETRIRWVDEEGTHVIVKTLYRALPHENHTAVQTCGKVSELSVAFPGRLLFEELSQIAVNRRIPFYFSGLRLLAVTLLFLAVILFVHKPLRVKAAYYLLEYKFDPADRNQNRAYVLLVVLTVLFSWFCVYTSISKDINSPMNRQYNVYLVDAFMAGRTNIDYGHPEKLLNAERPNDYRWLTTNGYKWGEDLAWDIAYYKGKFYTYYGPVPVVLLYLPYKLITGNYLSHHAGVSVFAAIAVVFMALLWRFSVKKYMPNARFAFYLLSFLALFSVSHLFAGLRYPTVWTIVQVAGLAFLLAGTFLLLKSVDKEKINRLQLFFACLCFALSVGCRPNMLLMSVLVPAVLWKRRSLKLAVFILIPYVLVAIPICLYNYARFDSVFQFGQGYCIAVVNGTAAHLLNPLAKVHRFFITLVFYLFRLYRYSLHFPYIELVSPWCLDTAAFGFIWFYNSAGGLINFPVLFCTVYLFKNIRGRDKPGGFRLAAAFFAAAAVMIAAHSYRGVFHGRYLMDCAVFFALSSLFCAYFWCDGIRGRGAGALQSAARLKHVYILLAASVFVGTSLLIIGSDTPSMNFYDPALYRYLESSLGLIERFEGIPGSV